MVLGLLNWLHYQNLIVFEILPPIFDVFIMILLIEIFAQSRRPIFTLRQQVEWRYLHTFGVNLRCLFTITASFILPAPAWFSSNLFSQCFQLFKHKNSQIVKWALGRALVTVENTEWLFAICWQMMDLGTLTLCTFTQ